MSCSPLRKPKNLLADFGTQAGPAVSNRAIKIGLLRVVSK